MFRDVGEIFQYHNLQLWILDIQSTAREHNDRGNLGRRETLEEDFLPDEASGAGEDDFHLRYAVCCDEGEGKVGKREGKMGSRMKGDWGGFSIEGGVRMGRGKLR